MSKILLIDSSKNIDPALGGIVGGLKEAGDEFFYWSAAKGWGGKRFFFGNKPAGFLGIIIFLFLLPFLRLIFFFRLLFWKNRKKIEALLLKNDREKIIFSGMGRMLGLKVSWLFMPEDDSVKKSGIIRFLLRLAAGKSHLIVFTEARRSELIALGFNQERVKNVSLGAGTAGAEHQDDIFSDMARANGPFYLKHFTIGAVAGLDNRKQFENFFRSLAICAKMIDGLQVIIIGEGKAKKDLVWLAKKMDLGRIVWFVGKQDNLRKWLLSFDVFAAIFERPDLSDLNAVLEAMRCRRPLVGFDSPDLRSIIIPGETGFLAEFSDTDALAEKILALEQDVILRNRFGENANHFSQETYGRERQLKKIRTIIAYEKEN